MSQQKHSPTPWSGVYLLGELAMLDADGLQIVAPKVGAATDQANVARTVACVNACAELEDPEKLITLIDTMRMLASATSRTDPGAYVPISATGVLDALGIERSTQ